MKVTHKPGELGIEQRNIHEMYLYYLAQEGNQPLHLGLCPGQHNRTKREGATHQCCNAAG
jgi:hypothetical protein